ncbi:MAG: hypothetical protein WCS73_10515 [Lentisphaeria bacterium]
MYHKNAEEKKTYVALSVRENSAENTLYSNKDHAEMSSCEKKILMALQEKPTGALSFPKKELKMRVGPATEEYIIPAARKAEILEALYPFSHCPDLKEWRYDLHEKKFFRVENYKVIYEHEYNFLVSPYYANSGGMVIDWLEDEKKRCQVLTKKKN